MTRDEQISTDPATPEQTEDRQPWRQQLPSPRTIVKIVAAGVIQGIVLSVTFVLVFQMSTSFLRKHQADDAVLTPQPALPSQGAVDEDDPRVAELSKQYNCTTRPDITEDKFPHALVRTSKGDIKIVPLQEGWDIELGRQPGTLLGVCTE